MSSIATGMEAGLARAGLDRAPWIAVFFGLGIVSWFALPLPWQWVALIGGSALIGLAGVVLAQGERRVYLGHALLAIGLAVALGAGLVWARSAMVGAPPIAGPEIRAIQGRVLAREQQPARERIRLTLAYRETKLGPARKIRVNLPLDRAAPAYAEGAVLRMRVRLTPPAPPLVPGAYNFARTAWFGGLAATGSVLGDITVVAPVETGEAGFAHWQRRLSAHVHRQLAGSAGAIAAAFASGDRGGITESDAEAMRDAGLTHLLAISGLHVSAVIAAAYVLAIRLLALWPWLALRVRLPLAAAVIGAAAGIGYTLLTGAQVPTVRSCVGAVLVLIALALGREPLSMRMVAVAAIVVLLLWPESVIGPSFQMSFAAVVSIIALHNTQPVRRFLAPREESGLARMGRALAMLLLTGLVIEIALMPVVLFHFHRAGLYGALANVVAIPLVTFVSMPLIAVALAFDLVGLGAPVWWLAGASLDLLLGIAHLTASQPGAVKLAPQMGLGTIALFAAGGLWLALWRGRARLFGFAPVVCGLLFLALTPAPDVLISRDGRHVGVAGPQGRLVLLRDGRSGYAKDTLRELAGTAAEPIAMDRWPAARCSPDFCTLTMRRGGRVWHLLMARSRDLVDLSTLAAACARSDIVVADRRLPRACRPRWLKADRRFLNRHGGLALFLDSGRIDSVAAGEGRHGWWRSAHR